MIDAVLALASLAALVALAGFWLGWSQGVRAERQRCERLCHQSTVGEGGRLSGSVRWVWNAVASGRDELLPAGEFFSRAARRPDPPIKAHALPHSRAQGGQNVVGS